MSTSDVQASISQLIQTAHELTKLLGAGMKHVSITIDPQLLGAATFHSPFYCEFKKDVADKLDVVLKEAGFKLWNDVQPDGFRTGGSRMYYLEENENCLLIDVFYATEFGGDLDGRQGLHTDSGGESRKVHGGVAIDLPESGDEKEKSPDAGTSELAE